MNIRVSHRSRGRSWGSQTWGTPGGTWGSTKPSLGLVTALERGRTASSLHPLPTSGYTGGVTDSSTAHNSTPAEREREGGRGREGEREGGRERGREGERKHIFFKVSFSVSHSISSLYARETDETRPSTCHHDCLQHLLINFPLPCNNKQ